MAARHRRGHPVRAERPASCSARRRGAVGDQGLRAHPVVLARQRGGGDDEAACLRESRALRRTLPIRHLRALRVHRQPRADRRADAQRPFRACPDLVLRQGELVCPTRLGRARILEAPRPRSLAPHGEDALAPNQYAVGLQVRARRRVLHAPRRDCSRRRERVEDPRRPRVQRRRAGALGDCRVHADGHTLQPICVGEPPPRRVLLEQRIRPSVREAARSVARGHRAVHQGAQRSAQDRRVGEDDGAARARDRRDDTQASPSQHRAGRQRAQHVMRVAHRARLPDTQQRPFGDVQPSVGAGVLLADAVRLPHGDDALVHAQ